MQRRHELKLVPNGKCLYLLLGWCLTFAQFTMALEIAFFVPIFARQIPMEAVVIHRQSFAGPDRSNGYVNGVTITINWQCVRCARVIDEAQHESHFVRKNENKKK